VPSIEPRRIGAQLPLHPGDQIGLRRFDHQMKMIAHQAIGLRFPITWEYNREHANVQGDFVREHAHRKGIRVLLGFRSPAT
jgi:hypothetical protein